MTIATVDHVSFLPSGATAPALDGVSMTIERGTITLVRGASGAGKSTLLRTLSGLVPHFHGGTFSGRVTVDGHDTRTTSVASLGQMVGSVFQDPETQSVRGVVDSDVAFGLECRAVPTGAIAGAVQDALRRIGAGHLSGRTIASLSGGERQRVAIAAAIATGPMILTLDEPTSQLDDAGGDVLCGVLRDLAADGMAIVIAEHNDHRLDLDPDHAIWMDAGRCVDVPHFPPPRPQSPPQTGDVRLSVRGLSVSFGDRPILAGCGLEVRSGEVVAITGPNGCGKSTLLRALIGVQAVQAGHVAAGSIDLTEATAEDRAEHLAFLPQDGGRRLLRERVEDEVADSVWATAASVGQAMDDLDVARFRGRHPLDLSVGERERIAIATVLATKRPVLLLDEPTRGMDPVRRRAMADVLRRRAARGAAVVLVTHDSRLVDEIADRHLSLDAGVLVPAPSRHGAAV